MSVEDVPVRPVEANLALGEDERVTIQQRTVDVVIGVSDGDRDRVKDPPLRHDLRTTRSRERQLKVLRVPQGVLDAGQFDCAVDYLENAVDMVRGGGQLQVALSVPHLDSLEPATTGGRDDTPEAVASGPGEIPRACGVIPKTDSGHVPR